jgi:hypothetical protein
MIAASKSDLIVRTVVVLVILGDGQAGGRRCGPAARARADARDYTAIPDTG